MDFRRILPAALLGIGVGLAVFVTMRMWDGLMRTHLSEQFLGQTCLPGQSCTTNSGCGCGMHCIYGQNNQKTCGYSGPYCGDGTVNGNEACDSGGANGVRISCCTSDCRFQPPGTACNNSQTE